MSVTLFGYIYLIPEASLRAVGDLNKDQDPATSAGYVI